MKMELEQMWKNMGTAEDTHSAIDFSIPGNAELKKTASPLFKIKKALQIGMVWIVIISLMYLAGIILFKPVITKLSLIILVGYSIFCFIQTLKLNQQINPMVIAGNSVKAELERHYSSMMLWCKTQERNSLFLYPVSLLGGAFLGLSIDGAERMNRAMHKPVLWITLMGFMIVFVPILYYVNRRMMKIAYYQQLEHLKKLISELESD